MAKDGAHKNRKFLKVSYKIDRACWTNHNVRSGTSALGLVGGCRRNCRNDCWTSAPCRRVNVSEAEKCKVFCRIKEERG